MLVMMSALCVAVASALANTFSSLEIIVVDRSSDDSATPAVVSALAGSRMRVLLRQGPPKVADDNRNFGIARARGRYVCCLDADDMLAPTYVEKTLFVMEQGGFDVLVTSPVEFGSRIREWRVPRAPTLDDCALQNETTCCALFRRGVWVRAEGYSAVTPQRNSISEDWEFWMRLAARGALLRNTAGETLMRYLARGPGPGTSLSSAPGLPSRQAPRRAVTNRLCALLRPEAMALSRRKVARRLRPANSITAMSEVLVCDSDTRRSAALGRGRTLQIAPPRASERCGSQPECTITPARPNRTAWRRSGPCRMRGQALPPLNRFRSLRSPEGMSLQNV